MSRIVQESRPWSRRQALVLLVPCLAFVQGCDRHDADAPGTSGLSEAEFSARRRELVEELEKQGIEDRRVLDAIAKIPRHEFVPSLYRDKSYEDGALPIAEGQSISRPSDIALTTQLLELKGDEKVLEVGTGSGYQAAVLACLAAKVYSIEIRGSLKDAAEESIGTLVERRILSPGKVTLLQGDGSRGYQQAAPYDGIVVTAASSTLRDELVEQLKPGGRLVIPVGNRFQELKLVRRLPDDSIDTKIIKVVRYIRLEE